MFVVAIRHLESIDLGALHDHVDEGIDDGATARANEKTSRSFEGRMQLLCLDCGL